TGSSVSVTWKHPHRPDFTVGDYRRHLLVLMFGSMLNARLSEIAHRADPPFLGAGGGGSGLSPTVDTWRMSASVADGGIERGLDALLTEAARLRQHGFLASELERAKQQRIKWDESAWAERDKSESDGFASAYVEMFLSGEPEPGIEVEHELLPALVGGITL